MKIIRYWIVTGTSAAQLNEKIPEWLRLGYEPHGPMQMHSPPLSSTIFAQTMVQRVLHSEYDDMEAAEKAQRKLEGV